MKIQNTIDVKPDKINCLIYSPAGRGKTTLASTLNGKTLIVSMEAGLLSLKNKSVDYVTVEGKNGVEKIEHIKKLLPEIVASNYDNIFFDSLSEISDCFLEVAKEAFPEARQALPRFGMCGEMMKRFVKFTRDMDKNIFYTALEKQYEDDVGRKSYVPDVIGAMALRAPGYFDFCLNLRIIEGERKLLTAARAGFITKDRSGELEEYEPPHLGDIINKVFKKEKL